MNDDQVVHVQISSDNRQWLKDQSLASGLSQKKLLNILIEFARNTGMQIRPQLKTEEAP